MEYTGAEILIQSLIDQGADTLFGYPGGAVLNIYDALYHRRDVIRHIVASHEQGAAHAADGYARSTGKVGVVVATSGPGATNLVTGLATAYLDSIPVVAITGNVAKDLLGRDSFQEVDIVSITKTVTKKNFFVEDASQLAATVREAFQVAASGRKGPVLIDIPKDVTAQRAAFVPEPPYEVEGAPGPTEEELAQAARLIEESRQPLIYCGGGVTFSDGAEALMAFAGKLQIPVCTSMMGVSSVPAGSELNLGLVGMHGTATANTAVAQCDLLLAVGARFSDRVAGNRMKFASGAKIIHLDIDRGEIGKNVAPHLALVGEAGETLARLAALLPQTKRPEWMHKLLRHKALGALPYADSDGQALNPREIVTAIRKAAGSEAILVTDVGQHQMLVAQSYPFTRPRSFLSSCGLGTMGYGMGAAVGAAVGNPDRPVVLVTGDGSFHMNLAELAVMVTHNLPVVAVILNNRVLGMVHQWQNLFYGGRYSFTEIDRRTDFVALAQAFGAKGLRIQQQNEIRPVLEEAMACPGPCVVDCVIDPGQRVYPIIPPGGNEDDMIYTGDL